MAAPETLVNQYLKTLEDNKISLDIKFQKAVEAADKLKVGGRKLLSMAQDLEIYGWFKVANNMKLPAEKPSFYNIEASAKWNRFNQVLNEEKLTADQCKAKYIAFFIDILRKRTQEASDILEPKTQPQPKKGLFSFASKPKAKPTDKAAAEAAGTAPVLFTNVGGAAAAAQAPNTAPLVAEPATLVAANKSTSDPTSASSTDKKKPEGLTLT